MERGAGRGNGLGACADKEVVEMPKPPTTVMDCQQDSILVHTVRDHQGIYDTVTSADLPLIQRIDDMPETTTASGSSTGEGGRRDE